MDKAKLSRNKKAFRTTIELEVYETVDVDVELEFDEIKQFFDNLNDKEKKSLLEGLGSYENAIPQTLEESLKKEILDEAFKKYSLQELETRLS